MLWEILLAIACGVTCGIFTGMVPGIHVNLVAVLLVALVPSLGIPPLLAAVVIITCAVTHTFIDSIPSIYLGAPDADQALSVLPGHRLLHDGKGHQAITYTVIGGFCALVIGCACMAAFIPAMAWLSPRITPHIGFILLGVCIFMILRESTAQKRALAFAFFLLAGACGILSFKLPLRQPLFHLLSGLFGLSILLMSLEQSAIPSQQTSHRIDLPLLHGIKAVGGAVGIGFCAAFMPGFGSSQAAIIAKEIVGDIKDAGFLVLVGGINTANMVISLSSAYALAKARNGAVVAVTDLIGAIEAPSLALFTISALIAGSVASVVALAMSRRVLSILQRIDYGNVAKVVIISIVLISFAFDSIIGLLLLLTTTSIGILAQTMGVGKNHLMGCLLLPVTYFFLV